MATQRLPIPGSDDGTWGSILNDFLLVEHNGDGTLKLAADIADAKSKADSAVQTVNGKAPNTSGAVTLTASDVAALPATTKLSQLADTAGASGATNNQVLAYDSGSNSWVPSTVTSSTVNDATSGSKGIVQLTGDLGGTAASPTVPGLAGKAPLASPTFTGTVTVPTPVSSTAAATKAYVDTAAANSAAPDATASVKGKVQLAGDLGGTAASPTVPGLASKAPLASPTFTGTVTVPTPVNTTDAATKAYVDTAASAVAAPDATASVKGKVQLAGDLGGTAASPTVAGIKGVAVSGTASNGQVLTASSSTTASWAPPASAPVSSVNAKTGAVSLVASDVGAVSTTQVGAANGVASLDSGTKVPASQLPDLSGTYLSNAAAQTLGMPLFVVESSGAYPNRPAWSGVVIFMGADAPASGGTTAGGSAKAVAGLDVWFRTA